MARWSDFPFEVVVGCEVVARVAHRIPAIALAKVLSQAGGATEVREIVGANRRERVAVFALGVVA
jgi:hypothetical protein